MERFYHLLHPAGTFQKADFKLIRNHLPYWWSIQNLKMENEAYVFIQPKAKGTEGFKEKEAFTINETLLRDTSTLGELEKGSIKGLSGSVADLSFSIASTTNALKPDEIDDILILVKYKVAN